ncbi:MAG: T9SS type A sorting domain-containing protein, partial [Cytophagales bacterium]|nr:T9SS type A sorting domain-containing protein [Cytophagales bacterium]
SGRHGQFAITSSGATASGSITTERWTSFSPGGFGSSDFTNLPVELQYFRAVAMSGSVKLTWATVSEQNNDYFEIQRAGSNLRFEAIGTVKGVGDRLGQSAYEFRDDAPLIGTAYYRLRQVDRDGQFEYSTVVKVVFEDLMASAELTFELSPNPTKKGEAFMLALSSNTAGPVSIIITDLRGQRIFIQKVEQEQLTQTQWLPEQMGLSEGIYLIELMQGGQQSIKRLVVY